VSETKDSIVVKAEIPGMDAKNIDISLSGDMLTIKGEKKQEKEEKDENTTWLRGAMAPFIDPFIFLMKYRAIKSRRSVKTGY
jgi:HSP20 family protein